LRNNILTLEFDLPQIVKLRLTQGEFTLKYYNYNVVAVRTFSYSRGVLSSSLKKALLANTTSYTAGHY